MDPEPTIEEVIAGLKAGDERVATELVKRYTGRLLAVAHSHLNKRLRQKVDADDILQSVLKSFFVRAAEGSLVPENWEHLWALLVRITVCKCSKWLDHFQSAKCDLWRETAGQSPAEEALIAYKRVGRDPTPDVAVMLSDLVETLLKAFEARDREIVSLHLQGYSAGEIEAATGRSIRTVFRVLESARTRTRRLIDQAED